MIKIIIKLDKNIIENREWLINTIKTTINSLNNTLNIFFKVKMENIIIKVKRD